MIKIFSKSYSTNKTIKIYSLKPFTKNQNHLIGNKANSLLKLFRYGFDIPDSLILDFAFFTYFKKSNKIPSELIYKILKENLTNKLAVRSSCSLEDSYNESYAGSFKTQLNVSNKYSEVEKAIEQCYQSLLDFQMNKRSNERAHHQNSHACMGIIIQSMITPKISGILFTCPSVNPDENHYQVEYCFGYGDQLTGSYLSGNSITLDKKTGKLVQQRGNISISEKDKDCLWKLSKKLEGQFDFPQDAEFVISNEDNKIFFIQSRPITAFNYTPEYIIKKENEKLKKIFVKGINSYGISPILSASNISEFFSIAVPLGYSIFKYIFTGTNSEIGAYNIGRSELGYKTITSEEQTQLFLTIGDKARTNLQIHSLVYCLQGIVKEFYLKNFVNDYLKSINNDPTKGNYPQFVVYIQNPSKEDCNSKFKKDGLEIYRVYSKFIKNILDYKIPSIIKSIPEVLRKNDNYYKNDITDYNNKINKNNNEFFIKDKNGFLLISKELDLTQLIDKYYELLTYLRNFLGVKYVIIARIAFLSSYIVKDKLVKLFRTFPDKLFNIKDKIHIDNSMFQINQYFNILLANENCPKEFECPNEINYLNNIKTDPLDLKELRQIFGHLGSLEISQPRLAELEDEILLKLIKDKKIDPNENLNLGANWLSRFKKQFKKLGLNSSEEFKDFFSWVHYAKVFMTLRETMKFELLKIIYLIKIIVKEIADRKNLGDLIYFLEYDEIEHCISHTNKFRLLAMKRKAYFNGCRNVEVDKVIMNDKASNIRIKNLTIDRSDGIYKPVLGTTIYHGEAEGICLTVRNTYEYYHKLIKYREDGITNIIGVFSGMEPAYFNLKEFKGIITEHGGYLAHAATIARENNIPYITNINIEKFQDGQYIVFDTLNNQIIYRQ